MYIKFYVNKSMQIATSDTLPDIKIIKPQIFNDKRGFFFESFNNHIFSKEIGYNIQFVQENHSYSTMGVLRGLHYQVKQHAQGKLVRVIRGKVFDVSVDIRRSSPYFCKWFGIELSASNKLQLWIPPGFAHGFLVISKYAEFIYKTTNYYFSNFARSIIWNDSTLGIKWPLYNKRIILSFKDKIAKSLKEAELFE